MEQTELTPLQRQYRAIKRELPPGTILMFRLGDFYEMFGEDAIVAAPILGATLTHRGDQPMCGVPYHAINGYLAKLIRAGKTAALCDQVEDPKLAKGLVRREGPRLRARRGEPVGQFRRAFAVRDYRLRRTVPLERLVQPGARRELLHAELAGGEVE